MVASLNYGACVGGGASGIMTFKVGLFEKGPAISNVDLLAKILNHPQGKKKHVRLFGPAVATVGEEEIFPFCTTLSEYGYAVSVVLNGSVLPSWCKSGSRLLIVSLHGEKPWLRHECLELWYKPEGDGAREPLMPAKVPNLYLDPGNLSPEGLRAFLREAVNGWSILLGEKDLPEERLFPKEKVKK